MVPFRPLILITAASLFATPGRAEDAITMAPLPKRVELSAAGDWGVLEHYKVRLSCPPEYLLELPVPSEKIEWVFPHETIEAVREFLEGAGITVGEIDFLLENCRYIETDDAIRVFPTAVAILEMPASLRSRFYRVLADLPGNPYHRRPAFLNTSNVSRYFLDSDLRTETLVEIATLAYPTPSGHGYFLADIPYLMKRAESSIEERRLLDTLLRVPALMVRLHLDGETPMDSLTNYWSGGFKNKQIRPLFESLVENPEVERIDIAHLIPPTARRNLNRFPTRADGLNGRYPDWFWTCYNFFRFTPRDVYADSLESNDLFKNEFYAAEPPYDFGDVILLNSGGRAIHGCIYIADDIVYTKNGADLFSPTILMRLRDVVAFHDLTGDVQLKHFRKKSSGRPPFVISPTIYEPN